MRGAIIGAPVPRVMMRVDGWAFSVGRRILLDRHHLRGVFGIKGYEKLKRELAKMRIR